MKRKILAVLLCTVLLLSGTSFALAATPSAKLYTIYDDDMLFAQEKAAVFAGVSGPGNVISAELYNSKNEFVTKGYTTTSSDGRFSVSFTAPKGSFEEYTVILKRHGIEFDRLKRVVFGELWLASGQSNMQYPLSQALSARDEFAAAAKQNKWIRAMVSDPYSADGIPVEPREDIPDANWITGEDPLIYGVSAVGFFFAEDLVEKLGMPVGVLNISLGGTSIGSWLSREAIDGNEAVKKDFLESESIHKYIPAENWNPAEADYYADMTSNYNLRIEAVKHFRPSGIIWYQGETDLIYRWSTQRYARALALLQESYTELFEYGDGLMPLIYTQIAPYFYSEEGWEHPDWNCAYSEFQAEQPDSRAMVTLYDLPVTFIPEAGIIHPEHKEEVGDRMAACAFNMVYSTGKVHSAAYIEASQPMNSSIYVSFINCTEKLGADGDVLKGFSVCGEDGVYVQAEAEIIYDDVVRIWSDHIETPVSAAYAYSTSNGCANLWSYVDGEKFMPVSPFITNPTYNTQFWVEKPWADCESDTVWHNNNEKASGYHNSWTAKNAEISFNSSSAFSGNNGMNIKSDKLCFSVSPLRSFGEGSDKENFMDVETNFSNYGTVSFYARNNGTEDIGFDSIRFYENPALWYAPANTQTNQPETVIPADGEWHLITLDLDRLCLWGNECGILFANDKLSSIEDIVFCFSGKNADIDIDHVRFAPVTDEEVNRFDVNIANADNIFEVISAVFVTIFGAVASLCNK